MAQTFADPNQKKQEQEIIAQYSKLKANVVSDLTKTQANIRRTLAPIYTEFRTLENKPNKNVEERARLEQLRILSDSLNHLLTKIDISLATVNSKSPDMKEIFPGW